MNANVELAMLMTICEANGNLGPGSRLLGSRGMSSVSLETGRRRIKTRHCFCNLVYHHQFSPYRWTRLLQVPSS